MGFGLSLLDIYQTRDQEETKKVTERAEYYTHALRQEKLELKDLTALEHHLHSKPLKWVKEFIDKEGLERLFSLVSRYETAHGDETSVLVSSLNCLEEIVGCRVSNISNCDVFFFFFPLWFVSLSYEGL